jgi:hypothetical protein
MRRDSKHFLVLGQISQLYFQHARPFFGRPVLFQFPHQFINPNRGKNGLGIVQIYLGQFHQAGNGFLQAGTVIGYG